MMQNDLESKNIVISGIEDTGWGIKLKDEKGLNYNVSKMLKDGSGETKAFQVLKTLPGFGMGMQKCVKFATVPNQQGGQSRYVRIIGEPEAEQANRPLPPQNITTGQAGGKIGFVAGGQTTRDFYAENFGKCKFGFLLEAYKFFIGKDYSFDGFMKIAEEEAEKLATMSMRKLDITQKLQEAGLTSNQEEEIQIDNIPF